MQIRLTVLGPRSGHQNTAAPASCDVLVTAPAGTPLAAVASGLAATVGGPDTGGTVVLYAGSERLDLQRRVLGEPPLVDGAVLALGAPLPDVLPEDGMGAPQLHVVAGPDAGGVHLLHGGQITVGRSSGADVPLDDPDVSRLHCAVTVIHDGRIAVADLDSTNGTTLDGSPVGRQPVALPPGALLQVGESTLRLSPPGPSPLPVTPDLEGHLALPCPGTTPGAPGPTPGGPGTPGVPAQSSPGGAGPAAGSLGAAAGAYGSTSGRADSGAGAHSQAPGAPGSASGGPGAVAGTHGSPLGGPRAATGGPGSAPGAFGAAAGSPGSATGRPGAGAGGSGSAAGAYGSTSGRADSGAGAHGQAPGAPRASTGGAGSASGAFGAAAGDPGAARDAFGAAAGSPGSATGGAGSAPGAFGAAAGGSGSAAGTYGSASGAFGAGAGAPGATSGGPGAATGGAGSATGAFGATSGGSGSAAGATGREPAPAGRRRGIGAWARKWVRGEDIAEVVPEAVAVAAVPHPDDPAALLLAAMGPTGRLWSRTSAAAPEIGLGTGSRVSLAAVGALGIAGPRARLAGVARWAVAQLAALHAPAQLEIVLVCADRARPAADRRRDWGWLGWLPHVRPAHGQDCRLLLAYDREQAAARTAELTRRLDDGPLGAHWATAEPDRVREAAAAHTGPYTLLVLDGDPGTGALRDLTGRLASHGPAAGIHVLALAEAPAATAASPVTDAYETACAALPAFRDCGTVALLSGDVATAVRTYAVQGGRPVPTGGPAVADGVSAAWAERFARALAPLRTTEGASAGPGRTTAAALPATARLLDELGLARATPASLMARWAAATDQGQGQGGLAEIVLGSGRRGPVGTELVHEGPHLVVEGPAGSGRTELLRSVAASLSAAARPDRLGLLLLDGAGGERGDGLLPCTELPHVSAHLVASDPLRMREFAQALGAELKRRAELLDGVPFAEWHAQREVSGRLVAPRRPAPGEHRGELDPAASGTPGRAEPVRTGTLRLRAAATRTEAAGPSPLPRLVVLVDDLDALVAPGLGSTGRPAAGSVVRALEAVARDGARLGVHLVASTARRPDRTADSGPARLATLRVELEAPDQPGPGRGTLRFADGRTVPFQAGRVTGRIPRTATLRPTVVPVEWERMGDPPARRPVRELGNGPTDLALLASALDRAAHLVSAVPVLFPPAP
ncbi:FHA domain-containing protein [Streptomyces sp. NPDC047014]|uniref:FHA domain-containing protein n=1 Tax=Streptomyces sp. NPDC047014 TaxID=3155736 RepID=UPI0033ED24A9